MIRIALILLACIALGGCNWDRILAQAESAAQTAQAQLAKAEAATLAAETAVEAARALADASNSEPARQAVAIAESALQEAKRALPVLRQAAADAETALAQAKEAHANGEGTWSIVIGLASVLVPALGTAVHQWRQAGKYRTAAEMAVDHGVRMRMAESDADADKVAAESRMAQKAAGVHSIIKALLPDQRKA